MSPRRVWGRARWRGCLVVLLALLASPRPATAMDCGGCTLSGLPSSRDLRFGLFPGELVVDVSFAGTSGERLAGIEKGARLHDAGLWFENRWVALLGFTHTLGLELEVPLRLAFTSIGRSPGEGAGAVHASHMGPGDTRLSLRYARPVGAWTVLATAGLSLPTGSTAAPLGSNASAEERAAIAAASGSGTWDPWVKLALTRRVGPFELVAVGQGRVGLAGRADRTDALRLDGSAGLSHAPGHRWRYGLSADVVHLDAVRGAASDAGAAARTLLLGSGFVQHRINTWSIRLSAHVPLVRWEAPEGRETHGWSHPWWVQLGVVTAFDVGV